MPDNICGLEQFLDIQTDEVKTNGLAYLREAIAANPCRMILINELGEIKEGQTARLVEFFQVIRGEPIIKEVSTDLSRPITCAILWDTENDYDLENKDRLSMELNKVNDNKVKLKITAPEDRDAQALLVIICDHKPELEVGLVGRMRTWCWNTGSSMVNYMPLISKK